MRMIRADSVRRMRIPFATNDVVPLTDAEQILMQRNQRNDHNRVAIALVRSWQEEEEAFAGAGRHNRQSHRLTTTNVALVYKSLLWKASTNCCCCQDR